MDIEYTLWQMFHLCVDPKKVYNTARYHKQTKNQWARDDPAFVALLLLFTAAASLSYAVAYHGTSWRVISLIFWTVLVDFLALGLLIATTTWWVANKYLRVESGGHTHTVEQSVEWLYALDIHCNAYFPLFVLLYVLQYFVVLALTTPSFLTTLIANTLYLLAFSYYHYITFLGYTALPFLQHTVTFLYPVLLLIVLYVLSLVFNFNLTLAVINFYFGK
jgi:hypothetical protein